MVGSCTATDTGSGTWPSRARSTWVTAPEPERTGPECRSRRVPAGSLPRRAPSRRSGIGLAAETQMEHHRAEPGLQLGGGTGVGHPPGRDDHHLIGQRVGFFQILGGQQHGGAGPGEVPHRVPQHEAALRVQAGGGLIEEQHLRLVQQRRGHVEPAPIPPE